MRKIKGIILAGGYGSRLYPLTLSTSKQLLPVYDKPMIYYPLSILMNIGIRDILIIAMPEDISKFKRLLENGKKLGLNILYETQNVPRGIAEAFLIAENFIGDDNVSLILGDNIFYGGNLKESINEGINNLKNNFSTIFGLDHNNPDQFGVIEFDVLNNINKIIEKPKNTKSNTIVTGLYFYTSDVVSYAKLLKPSNRKELEISELNNNLLNENKLKMVKLDDNVSWIDTGTYDSLINASMFFLQIEKNQGFKVACVEEIAFNLNYINKLQFKKLADSMSSSEYGKYLLKMVDE